MKLHANARTCPRSRRVLVVRVIDEGWSVAAAAEAAAISTRTAAKWLARYRREGEAGLADRSSAAHRVARRTPPDRVAAIASLRRLGMTAAEIQEVIEMPLSTISAVLRRIGLGKLSRLEPPEPANRYQHARPGGLVHVDVKKLARIDRVGHRIHGQRRLKPRRRGDGRIGYEYVHVCVDDATRLAYAEVLADEQAASAAAFLGRAVAWYAARGITVERVLTDNGPAYRAAVHALACRQLGVRHVRTRPYRPRTNGKAERFIRTLLHGWAYAAIYGTSSERRRALPAWLDFYNHRRPHSSLGRQPPARAPALLNNATGIYI